MKPILIVGGGVAGLTLGIALRRAGVPVTVFEARDYPRHKVCGEFISGAGQDVLARLELTRTLIAAGARTATTGAVFLGRARSPVRTFPRPALCIARYHLDKALADVFTAMGGCLQTNVRRSINEGEQGIVWAAGRRAQATDSGWRWFGVKAHASGVSLTADLEMHSVADGYVGICRLAGGKVNVCGLFRRRARGSVADRREILRGEPGSTLRRRMAQAVFDEGSFCAVAGLSWKRAPRQRLCCIGDAFAMVPPVTGNGMSIAFETAALAMDPLLRFSQGRLMWPETQETIASKCSLALNRRLRWANWLHRAMMSRIMQTRLGFLVLDSNFLWRLLFDKTRSAPTSVAPCLVPNYHERQ